MAAENNKSAHSLRSEGAVGNLGVIETGIIPSSSSRLPRRILPRPASSGLQSINEQQSEQHGREAGGGQYYRSNSIGSSLHGYDDKSGGVGDGATTTTGEGKQLRPGRAVIEKCHVVDSSSGIVQALFRCCSSKTGRKEPGKDADVARASHNSHASGTAGTASGTTSAGKRRKGTKRTLLHPMRVDIPAGSITAILGPAGSGKSTLLKFLAGCMDHNVVYEGAVNLPGTTSYLPEETLLHRFYTPRTYLQHYDKLICSGRKFGIQSLPSSMNIHHRRRHSPNFNVSISNLNTLSNLNNLKRPPSSSRRLSGDGGEGGGNSTEDARDDDVEHLLDSLRIDRDRRDMLVGDAFRRGLSQGEQRRLELGLLVLGGPDTLFCENPVGGLDSETSLHIMEFLKGYSADPSRRVIVTLNKPSLFVWNLIDNVILLSKGRIAYEGPRFDMESFFAFHQVPTPPRFSPLEHYLAVVDNFRRPSLAVNWETAFQRWQEEADKDEGDMLADDIETCFPSAVPTVMVPKLVHGTRRRTPCAIWSRNFVHLLKRYILQLFLNPGMLQIRMGMYFVLSLFLGILFYDLEADDSYQSIHSRSALLFYSSSFFIFMVVAILPFLAHDRDIMLKEVLNGYYHPITHHLAVALSSILAAVILAFMITLILVGMAKLKGPWTFFWIYALALWCAESMALLVSIYVKNYIIGIVLLCGVCGLFMALEGFMLVPSKFPSWIRWANLVPFHTYAWRSLMYNEFSHYTGKFDSSEFKGGMDVLISFEIENTDVGFDTIVLFSYSLIIQLFCLSTLLLRRYDQISKKLKES